MIALIDYGSGNIRSVCKALQREGAEVQLVDSEAGLAKATAVVLPGVGAFGDCVRNLKSRKLWDPMRNWLDSGKPFLGICVGYQLLFDASEEDPEEKGFGFFSGKVKRFTEAGLKIPHMGWNNLDLVEHPLWKGLPANPSVFFVHSYFPVPEDASIITSRTTYGETFAASAARGRVAAVQFHPEKSQALGLTILRNFIQTI